ncbi:MAG: hypothetical protein MUC86_07565 [Burkholderiaceae bacterium]|jgi:hypothetical protein|nr:hypothetical protein [Burkholderiaceae bacterium]
MPDKRYYLTPFGAIGAEACNQLILQMVKTGWNGIVLEDGQLRFVNLELDDEK